jgi:hypothetical protein
MIRLILASREAKFSGKELNLVSGFERIGEISCLAQRYVERLELVGRWRRSCRLGAARRTGRCRGVRRPGRGIARRGSCVVALRAILNGFRIEKAAFEA